MFYLTKKNFALKQINKSWTQTISLNKMPEFEPPSPKFSDFPFHSYFSIFKLLFECLLMIWKKFLLLGRKQAKENMTGTDTITPKSGSDSMNPSYT